MDFLCAPSNFFVRSLRDFDSKDLGVEDLGKEDLGKEFGRTRCTHTSFIIRRQRGHPGLVLPLAISNSANNLIRKECN